MLKTFLKLMLGVVFLISVQACAPGQPTLDPDTINTAIAQTLAADTPTSGPGIPVTGDESATPTATLSTPTFSTVIATPTSTALILPTLSLTSTPGMTPVGAEVSVSVPTNCRVGPGTAYTRVGALLVGEVAEVVGRHADRDYLVIRNPDRPGELCWLWGNYATLTGNMGALPVLTPPPAPTPTVTPTPNPNFDATYSNLESCAGTGWWVEISLANTGGISFTSMSLTVTDTVTTTARALHSDDFVNRNGCNELVETRDALHPRTAHRVSSSVFPANIDGHLLRATITLCSNPAQSGTCITKTIEFTP